jgi:membrane protein implicated in regulation of membrane protease activity
MLWAWIIFGAVLMLLEILLPGLVVVFLGLGAWVVALALKLGWVEGWMMAGTLWFISSLVLIIGLRGLITRFLPGDTDKGSELDEDLDAFGKVVEVVEEVSPENEDGRIRFQGSSWPAVSEDGSIPAGNRAKIIARQNLVWVVEPAELD